MRDDSPAPSERRSSIPLSTGERRHVLRSGAVGSILALTIILAGSGGDLDRMAYGDGLLYRAVAARIGAAPDEVNPVVAERGSSLRYGRIGLPSLIWVASAGLPAAMPYAQPVVIVLVTGVATAAAAALFPRAGLLGALLPFLAPGFPLSVSGGYAEVLAVAAGLWAVWFATRARWWPSAALLSVAMLAKENAGAILLGLIAWALLRRDRRGAAILPASLAPVATWYLFVAVRYGHVPPFDPYLRVTTDTVGVPGAAIVQSLLDPVSTESLVMAIVHVGAGAVAVLLARRSVFGVVAAAATLQVLGAAPFAWRYIGDAARISTILQLFTILAVVAWRRPAWPAPQTLRSKTPG